MTDTCVSVSAFGVIVEADAIDCTFGKILVALIVAAFSVPVNVGPADRTTLPVPVEVVTPVPPLATGKVPETCVVSDTPDSVPPKVNEPLVVTVPVRVRPLTVPAPLTDVTLPPPVPAPMAARNEAASRADTVLSALKRGNVTAEGSVIVNMLPPRVDAPRLVRATAAVVAPVPPLAIANVPPSVSVPLVVIGPPENVSPVVPPEASTDVTVPPLLGGVNANACISLCRTA